MPRKSFGRDSRMITYRTLPGSSTRYRRVSVGECTAWVQTNLEFDLEVQHPDQTTETRPFITSPALAEGTPVTNGSRAGNRAALSTAIRAIPSQPRHQACRRLVAIPEDSLGGRARQAVARGGTNLKRVQRGGTGKRRACKEIDACDD